MSGPGRGAHGPDPYRILFPIGLAWGLIGAGLWPVYALGGTPWPGTAHRLLMMQAFEQSFVLGFLLTAMPGLTRGERCRPAELVIAAACVVATGFATLAGHHTIAAGAFGASIVLLLVAGARRVRHADPPPPLELAFVGFGLALGLLGAAFQLGAAWGLPEPRPRFAERLISLGMVLSLVLGVGSLLVPAFIGMRAPLAIPGIAGPHERRGRRALYGTLIAAFALAFATEWQGRPIWGAVIRAGTATVLGLLVWKLWRLPGRRVLPAWVLWISGWLVLAGLWLAALTPTAAIAALHLTFIGGFSLLTLGIATRVVVTHGRHPLDHERRVITPAVVVAMALALALRLAADAHPDRMPLLLGASGGLWALAWGLWAAGALPRIARTRSPAPPIPPF